MQSQLWHALCSAGRQPDSWAGLVDPSATAPTSADGFQGSSCFQGACAIVCGSHLQHRTVGLPPSEGCRPHMFSRRLAKGAWHQLPGMLPVTPLPVRSLHKACRGGNKARQVTLGGPRVAPSVTSRVVAGKCSNGQCGQRNAKHIRQVVRRSTCGWQHCDWQRCCA